RGLVQLRAVSCSSNAVIIRPPRGGADPRIWEAQCTNGRWRCAMVAHMRTRPGPGGKAEAAQAMGSACLGPARAGREGWPQKAAFRPSEVVNLPRCGANGCGNHAATLAL